jgi:hypothetical protein
MKSGEGGRGSDNGVKQFHELSWKIGYPKAFSSMKAENTSFGATVTNQSSHFSQSQAEF